MKRIQVLRVISIFAALTVGVWIPLRLINFPLSYEVDLFFDLLISAVSIVNVYLHFKEKNLTEQIKKSWRSQKRFVDLIHAFSASQLKKWMALGLVLDLICALPLLYLDRMLFQSEHQYLLLFNLLTARHIFKIKPFLDEFHNLQPVVYRLVPIALTMPLLVHLVACTWIALGSGTAGPDPDRTFEYVKAIYWAFTTLTTVGYGDISAKLPVQMLFCCVVQVVGVGVFGFVLSNVASLLSRMDAAREHHMESLDRIETFMRSNDIPSELRNKVRTYYHYLWKTHKGYKDQTLLADLPEKMQSELFFSINKSIVEKVPLFKGASLEMIEDLMNELKPKILVPNEKVFRIDEHGDAMYFIHNGSVEIIGRDNNVIATLSDGAFFGEMALISDGSRSATAKASEYSNVYVLSKKSFVHVMHTHPDFKKHIEKVMHERLQKAA